MNAPPSLRPAAHLPVAPIAGEAARSRRRPSIGTSDADVRRVLDEERFHCVFQPVVDLRSGQTVGCEALTRFDVQPYRTPDLWFADAEAAGIGTELELAAIRRAAEDARALPPGTYVTLNVAPRTLVSAALREFVASLPADLHVVLELTEHARVTDYGELQRALAFFRARGVRLAVDDAGAGFSSFQHILELRPDIIKLDRTLTTGVDGNPVRYALASALVTFASSLGAKICAEGIETSAELVALQQLGVHYGQGYFLARPAPLPLRPAPAGHWFFEPETAPESAPASVRLPSPEVRSPSRLEALTRTRLVSLERDEALDRLTRLAAKLLRAPIALVSLVDGTRQVFKSAVGIDIQGTPLSHSFCAHVVTTGSPLVIDNASVHPLVKDNPVVDEMGIAAYAGFPIVVGTSGGEKRLGSFCVVDMRARAWTSEELAVLRDLASLASAQVDLRNVARALDDNARLLDTLLDSSGDATVIVTLDMQVDRATDSFCALLDRPRSEIEGQPVAKMKSENALAVAFAFRDDLLSGRVNRVCATTAFLKADGTSRDLAIACHLLRDASGAPVRFVVRASVP